MRVRRTLAAIGVVAAMTALSACNDGNQAKKAGDAQSSASASSSTQPSSSSSPSSGHLDRAGLVKALTLAQMKAGSAHVVMRMTGATSLRAQGDVAYHGKSPQMRMTMTMAQLGNAKMELRFVDGILYLQIPHLTPAGKFIRVDPQDKSNPLGKNFGSLSEQMNPLNSLTAMKAGVRTVRYVGHDTIDGASTDHYVVTVDGAALTRAMKQSPAGALPKRLTYDMWLDQKNLLRRMRFELQGLTVEMDVTRWGEPVHVQAPSASQVVNPSRLAG